MCLESKAAFDLLLTPNLPSAAEEQPTNMTSLSSKIVESKNAKNNDGPDKQIPMVTVKIEPIDAKEHGDIETQSRSDISAMAPSQPGRKMKKKGNFSLNTKMEILRKLEMGKTAQALSREYNVKNYTIRMISKKADEIRKAAGWCIVTNEDPLGAGDLPSEPEDICNEVNFHPECLLKEVNNMDDSTNRINPYNDSLEEEETIADDILSRIGIDQIKLEPIDPESEEEVGPLHSCRVREEIIANDIPSQEQLHPVPVKLVRVSIGNEGHYNVAQSPVRWERSRAIGPSEETEVIIKEEVASYYEGSSGDDANRYDEQNDEAKTQKIEVPTIFVKEEKTSEETQAGRARRKRKMSKKSLKEQKRSEPKVKMRRNQMRQCREATLKKGRKRKKEPEPKAKRPTVEPKRRRLNCKGDLRCAYRRRCISDRAIQNRTPNLQNRTPNLQNRVPADHTTVPAVQSTSEGDNGCCEPIVQHHKHKPGRERAIDKRRRLQRERMRKWRASLTPEQLEQNRAKEVERKAALRQKKTPEERERMLRHCAQRARIRRLTEPPEQKAERRLRDKLRRSRQGQSNNYSAGPSNLEGCLQFADDSAIGPSFVFIKQEIDEYPTEDSDVVPSFDFINQENHQHSMEDSAFAPSVDYSNQESHQQSIDDSVIAQSVDIRNQESHQQSIDDSVIVQSVDIRNQEIRQQSIDDSVIAYPVELRNQGNHQQSIDDSFIVQSVDIRNQEIHQQSIDDSVIMHSADIRNQENHQQSIDDSVIVQSVDIRNRESHQQSTEDSANTHPVDLRVQGIRQQSMDNSPIASAVEFTNQDACQHSMGDTAFASSVDSSKQESNQQPTEDSSIAHFLDE